MIYDRILIQIRERSFLDLLDLALLVVRERPLPLFVAALGRDRAVRRARYLDALRSGSLRARLVLAAGDGGPVGDGPLDARFWAT